jgi:hypothetical protein
MGARPSPQQERWAVALRGAEILREQPVGRPAGRAVVGHCSTASQTRYGTLGRLIVEPEHTFERYGCFVEAALQERFLG